MALKEPKSEPNLERNSIFNGGRNGKQKSKEDRDQYCGQNGEKISHFSRFS